MSDQLTLLVVDDDADFLRDFKFLIGDQYRVITTSEVKRIRSLIKEFSPDIVFLDLFLGDYSGLSLLKQIKKEFPQQACIMITEHGSIDTAVEAIKSGAENYITKNFNVKEIQGFIEQVLQKKLQQAQSEALMEESFRPYRDLIGQSPPMLQVKEKIALAAQNEFTVLISGESGTGKELVARLIHKNSARVQEIFLPVNCGALPANLIESELFGHEKGAFTGADKRKLGKFEIASNGTMFLDEISELSLTAQVKLLRVLYNKEFERVGGTTVLRTNARIIAASNKDLNTLMAEGRFREDLFYRLNVFPIELPPLRQRREDIPLLLEYILRKKSRELGKPQTQLEPSAIDLFMQYDWPGNIREMENIVSRLIILAKDGLITSAMVAANLQPDMQPTRDYFSDENLTWENLNRAKRKASAAAIEKVEREFLDKLLQKYDGNVIAAAKDLGLNKSTLYRMVQKYRK